MVGDRLRRWLVVVGLRGRLKVELLWRRLIHVTLWWRLNVVNLLWRKIVEFWWLFNQDLLWGRLVRELLLWWEDFYFD